MVRRVLAGLWATCVFAVLPATVASAATTDVVLYASDAANLHGNWARVPDATAAGGQLLSSADQGWSSTVTPLAAPADFFDFTFSAPANTPYHIWVRLRAASNSKWNDSLFAQFSDARDTNGAAVFALGSTDALTVNLATNAAAKSLIGWGWQDGAYWLPQAATVTFATTGPHTLRIQTREDGIQIDQVVLSPSTYLTSAPGPVSNDTKIVPKPIVPSTPFTGIAIALPGAIRAENFDNGGEGLAYHDASAGNAGNDYRATDVDIQASSLGGYDVGWMDDGEWLAYTVNAATSGLYLFQFQVASPAASGRMHARFGSADSAAIAISNTGGWQNWTTVSVTASLTAGPQVMKMIADVGGFNLAGMTATLIPPPAMPVAVTPVNGTTGTSTVATLNWSAAGATSYDLKFGTTTTPPPAATGLSAASFAPSGMVNGTRYFWQVVARNNGGVTVGPVSSFTTIVEPPATPVVQTPVNGAIDTAMNATLIWNAPNATSYDVNFGTTNPPAPSATGLSSASYAPVGLTNGTTYFWQVIARNDGGSTAGPVSSFTTLAPLTNGDIVIYASAIPAAARHGSWTTAADASSPNNVKLVTPDSGVANPNNPLASPVDYVDVSFNAPAGTPYRIWMRLQALANSKYNDAVWLQFSDALAGGSSIYPIGTTAGLLVNLATDAGAASLNKWGWQNTAYWLTQQTTVSFATSGTHTVRVQVREDGVQFDQIVLSPTTYLNAAPGLLTNDNTIVSTSVALQPPSAPVSPNPSVAATGVNAAPTLTWSAAGAVSYDVRFGTSNPPAGMTTGQANAAYSPAQLANGATYFWQIVARNLAGTTTGPVWSFTTAASGSGTTWNVTAGGDLQAAINNAQPGDTILLQAGATFTGNFVLPAKTGNAFITIRSSASDAQLPGPNTRVTPADAALLPKLKSATVEPALRTDPGAHHYRLMFLEFPPTYQGYYDIMRLGDGSNAQNTMSMVPYELVLDHVYVHGDPIYGQKRAIALNSASTTIVNSYIAEIRAIGQDSQAIGGINGPGPYTIVNNYLEAAGENIMFGGADPAIPNLVPSDIVIRGNHLYKPLAWRSQTQWTVKNLFELKNAQRVVVDGNIMENNWAGGQSGYAVMLTPRNQDGACPWCVVQDLQFTNNLVRNASGGINILGTDNNHPSLETNHIVVRNNLFEDISGTQFGGQGRFLLMTSGGHDYTFDHNTVLQDGWTSVYVSNPVQNFVFTSNIIPDYSWAIMGDGMAPGNATITTFFPYSIFLGNIFAGSSQSMYPAGNHYPASFGAVGFVNYVPLTGGNYRLALTSLYSKAGNDGKDVGVDIDVLNVAAGISY